jgi:hypothetical protein
MLSNLKLNKELYTMKPLFTLFGSLSLALIIYCVIMFIIGGFCWPYLLIHAAQLLHHAPVNIAFWQGGLLGMVPAIGWLCIPGVPIVWILGLFI